jgi:phosphodiesterase/alkaline phosphatase D-like protein
MLGSTQFQWLKDMLLEAQNGRIPWKFVAISSPIDRVGGTQAPDGKSWWGGYRSERDQLLKFIADNHIDHLVFLTTDDHHTRVTQLQYLANPNDPNSKAVLPAVFRS